MMKAMNLKNNNHPFPTIEEIDNEYTINPKTTSNVNVNRKKFIINKQKTLAFPQLSFKPKTKIEVKPRVKKRKMTRTEDHINLNQFNDEVQKRISNQSLIHFYTRNSFQIGIKPFLSITKNNFSLIQTSFNQKRFTNLVICSNTQIHNHK